jgi:hypothetical protein
LKPNDKLLVILGLDSEKKPHAARFDLIDEAAVRKAASHKGFKIGRPETKEAAEQAGKLIEGRIFDSGRGLVPFVSPEIYTKLIALLKVEDVAASPPLPQGPKVAAKVSSDPWLALKEGSVVLCRDNEKGSDRSWWECTVVGVNKDSITVRWKFFPALKPFTVKRNAVAVLYSKA